MSYIPPVIQITDQTTNATPKILYSVPLGTNQAVLISVTFVAKNSTSSDSTGGSTTGLFRRASGNITRDGNMMPSMTASLGMGVLVFTITANTGTQKADITVTGIAATTINYSLAVSTLYVG